MEGRFREIRHLKDFLLVNLDLIERQQELLLEKDKRIQQLLHENETVGFIYWILISRAKDLVRFCW